MIELFCVTYNITEPLNAENGMSEESTVENNEENKALERALESAGN